ncbi:hypothetical protein CEB3_c01450 [Peptococcaceae bacterium CEB3]|nr:hypothetical protein CEB3_c01450 [Peptococcaceae bacterium CEB3]
MVALLILLFIGIIVFEVPNLVKKKMWRELTAFSLYLAMGMTLSILEALRVKVPNPAMAVEVLFKPLSGLLK